MTALFGIAGSPFSSGGNIGEITLDSTTDYIAFRFAALSTTAIDKLELRFAAEDGTPGDLKFVLAANSGSGPSMTGAVPDDIGGGSPTLVSKTAAQLSANAINQITFTNSYTPSIGDLIWLVVYPDSGGTFDGGNKYRILHTAPHFGPHNGNCLIGSSTDSGSTWSLGTNGLSLLSILDSTPNFIEIGASVALDGSSGTVDWDDSDNPDERGMAIDIPANATVKVHGVQFLYRMSAATSDFELAVYKDDTQVGTTHTIDVSAYNDRLNTNIPQQFIFPDGSYTVAGAGTLRATARPTHASDTIRMVSLDLGTQARRESCRVFRDMWYCFRDGGAGGFTDDKTQIFGIVPIIEIVGTAGGGGLLVHPGTSGGARG